jgi:hypothetical protein
VTEIALTPTQAAMLTCKGVDHIPGWTPDRCQSPPKGWRCNLPFGHEGPCPAWPDTIWLKLKWAIKLRSLSILFGRHLNFKDNGTNSTGPG